MPVQPDICVVMNAGSGKRDGEGVPRQIREAFEANGQRIVLVKVENGKDLEKETRAVVEQGFPVVVAAGGDGTICAVASVLRGTGRTLGILPLGTFNYFARSFDLPQDDLPAAAKVICSGKSVPLRMATLNDKVFLNNASLGIYPAILETRESVYSAWGRSRVAAYWSVLKTLMNLRGPLKLRIVAGDEERQVRTPLVFAVNNAFQLQMLALEGSDRIAAGELAVFIAPDGGRWAMIRHAVALALGLAEPHRNFELIGASEVEIDDISRRKAKRRKVARDGENERLRAPFRLKVIENELDVMVPGDWQAEVR